MLLLTSNGLSSQALLNCVQSNMNNGKSAVIITTASAPFKRNDKHIPRLTAELESIGYSVDFFDFDEDDPKELLQYDLVEIIGGNPFYLLRSIRHAGAELILKQLAKGDLFWIAVDEQDRVIGSVGYNSIPDTSEIWLHRKKDAIYHSILAVCRKSPVQPPRLSAQGWTNFFV